jgi:hypothetical protein
MKPSDLQPLLSEFAAGRLAILKRHEAAAVIVAHYDFNNTYQYVISREETHLAWLLTALAEFGATLPPASSTLALPDVGKGKTAEPSLYRAVLEDDARELGRFVDRWRPQVEAMSHARHRSMLRVILGESMEHKRLFEQAAAGFEDVLGRRTGGVARQGGVLPTRWQE